MAFDFVGDAAPASRAGGQLPDRLFLALKPNPPDADRIWAIAQDIITSHHLNGKRISAACLHLSLVSCGAHDGLSPQLLDKVRRSVSTVATPPFDVTLDRLCRFGGDAIVLRSSASLHAARLLRYSLLQALAHLPIVRLCNAKQFDPHVTVLYSDARFSEKAIEPVGWRADRLELVHSLAGYGLHRTVDSWPLSGDAVQPYDATPQLFRRA
jgi:2'-5' RNA ligase